MSRRSKVSAQRDEHGTSQVGTPRPLYELAGLLLILLTTLLIYVPALSGERLWDDDAHITSPELQSVRGLYRIWFELDATQQYYPLLHSAFWIEHKLWGDSELGYHLVNVFWHMCCVVLLYLVLMRLKIPGELLAAAIFAVHPVMVESVAWMSEQKNTLSGIFYLSAMFIYLGFDQSRKRSRYFAALGLFLFGLLTKTVTATLPAALLVIFWWQRGSLSWKRDVVPLLPFFVFGAVGGLFTAWVERTLIGAQGNEFEMTFLQRGLLAGRVVWFYLSKLVWPANLMFIYPHWNIDPSVWWQWLFPIATLSTLVLLWCLRGKTRGPLAGWLLFVGTLTPVLGFVNVFPFIYSYVADHFQYLASLGMIVLAAAGVTLGVKRLPQARRRVAYAGCVLLLCTLAALSARQCSMYTDAETLYRTAIDRNPECWLAYNNLGAGIAQAGKFEGAIGYYQSALRIKPDDFAAHNNFGIALVNLKKLQEGIDHYREAIRIEPKFVDARKNLAQALVLAGRAPDAIEEAKIALQLRHDDPAALNVLGTALMNMGRPAEAREQIEHALQLQPEFADARNNLGLILAAAGKLSEAAEQLRIAIALNEKLANAHSNLASVLATQENFAEAIVHFERAIQLGSDFPDIHNSLANAYLQIGQPDRAIEHYQLAVQLQPDYVQAHFNLAKALAAGDRSQDAIAAAQKATEAARSAHDDADAEQIEEWLKHYQIELHRTKEAGSTSK